MPNEPANTHEKPVVAVGRDVPRLLTLTDTGRYAVVEALRAFDALPPGFADYAHRRMIADALAACRTP